MDTLVSTNFPRIKSGYELRVYTLEDLMEFVEKKMITEEEFHWITSYSYEGIQKNRAGN